VRDQEYELSEYELSEYELSEYELSEYELSEYELSKYEFLTAHLPIDLSDYPPTCLLAFLRSFLQQSSSHTESASW
jgi:hypothetical protein